MATGLTLRYDEALRSIARSRFAILATGLAVPPFPEDAKVDTLGAEYRDSFEEDLVKAAEFEAQRLARWLRDQTGCREDVVLP